MNKPKRPRDPNQRAKEIMEMATTSAKPKPWFSHLRQRVRYLIQIVRQKLC